MAGGQFRHLCLHVRGEYALQLYAHHPVLRRDDVPVGARRPGGAGDGVAEGAGGERGLEGGQGAGFDLGQVGGDILDPALFGELEEAGAVVDDVRERGRRGIGADQRAEGLARIGREGGDID